MYDQHSSEEELEVINGPSSISALNIASASVVNYDIKGNIINRDTADSVASGSSIDPDMYDDTSVKRASSTLSETRKRSLPHSSDDEVRNLLDLVPTPVNFRTSPPLEALKPNRNTNLMFRSTTPLILTETSRGIENIKISCDSNNDDINNEANDDFKNNKLNKDLKFSSKIDGNTTSCNLLNSGQSISIFNQYQSQFFPLTGATALDSASGIGRNLSPSASSPARISSAVMSIGSAMDLRSISPPAKLFHCAVSPRRRVTRGHNAPQRLQRPHRPCLDFDKMQQLKVKGNVGSSVFCW